MRGFVGGFIVGVLIIIIGGYLYFASGMAPVATASPSMPFERQLAHAALDAVINKEMPKTVPIEANEANYLAGARTYLDNCAVCHGAPGKQPSAIARGEFPRPPQLLHGKGVTDDPAGETYWKTANGIRLTGMPGFKESLSETQMWQISLMLANADKLPGSAMSVLSGTEAAGTPVPMPAVLAAPPAAQLPAGPNNQPPSK